MKPLVPLQKFDEVMSIVSRISIFGGLTDAQRARIFERLEAVSCPAGELVFARGDEPSHIYIVECGSVELFIPDQAGRIRKKRLGVGECFGHVAVLSIHQHTVSALALEDSTFIVLSKHALHGLHHEDVELFALLMLNIARELARRLQWMDELLIRSAHAQPAAIGRP